MVSAAKLFRFARREEGTAMIEGLIVFPLVLMVLAAFFEFGYAVFQWNQTVKALQAGARHAAVSNPLIDDLTVFNGTGDPGDPVPGAVVSASCGAGTTPCVPAAMNRLIFGARPTGVTDDTCGNPGANSIPGMCDFNSRIGANNVLVTYYRAGLGYQGRPDGPVLTIRLEVKDITFDLPIIGALLRLNQFTIPAHPVTITSEDLCSANSC